MKHCPGEIWEGLSGALDFTRNSYVILGKPDLPILHLTPEENNHLHAVLKLTLLSCSAARESNACIT